MRDILFKGKTIDTPMIEGGQWIEGSLVYIKNDKETVCKITDTCLSASDGMMIAHDVDPETVCQYTGLVDKDGRKIFEGDIVRYEECIGIVKFVEAQFYIDWKKPAKIRSTFSELFQSEIKVIGNMLDKNENKITLAMTVDIYTEESGLDKDEVKSDIADFVRGILVIGADAQKISLALQRVECEGVTWTKQ